MPGGPLRSTQSLGEVQRFLANPPGKDDSDAKVMRYRLVFLATQMRGEVVALLMADGSRVEGVLHALDFDGGKFILKMAQMNKSSEDTQPQPFVEHMEVKVRDMVCMQMVGTKFQKRAQRNFMTDTQISSGARKDKRRELQMWKPEEGDEEGLDTLEGNSQHWDQFKANEKLTGRKSSGFNLDEYSTALDKNSEFYRKNEAEAARLAAEIEGRKPKKPIKDLDEDALYSKVLRDDATTPKKDTSAATDTKSSPSATTTAAQTSPKEAKTSPLPPKEEKANENGDVAGGQEKKKTVKSKLNANAKAFIPKFGRRFGARPANVSPAGVAQMPQPQPGFMPQPMQRPYPGMGANGPVPVQYMITSPHQGARHIQGVQTVQGMQYQVAGAPAMGAPVQQPGGRMVQPMVNPQMLMQANGQHVLQQPHQMGMPYQQQGGQFQGGGY